MSGLVLLYYFSEIPAVNANSADPDQTLLSAASDLGLHCWPITLFNGGLQTKEIPAFNANNVDSAFYSIWSGSALLANYLFQWSLQTKMGCVVLFALFKGWYVFSSEVTNQYIWAVSSKNVFWHVRTGKPRSACTSLQSDQDLHCPQPESMDTTECIKGEQIPDETMYMQRMMWIHTFCAYSRHIFWMTRPIWSILNLKEH